MRRHPVLARSLARSLARGLAPGLALALVLAVCAVLAMPSRAASVVSGTVSGTGSIAVRKQQAPPRPAPGSYTPPAGVKTNNPLGSRAQRRAITAHILRTIESVPGREKIRVASWNVRSDEIIDALIRAHKRGVSVRLVMDRVNSNPDNPNDGVDRLARVLGQWGNKWRKWPYKSFVRRCVSACRGPSGIAHTKFFLFTRAGNARMVVINGSFNATDLAASHQWNDVFTVKGRWKIWVDFKKVFDEMSRDKNVADPLTSATAGNLTTYFHPWRGQGTGDDPVLGWLDDVVCAGATNGTGSGGKTRIRIAMTSWHGQRGIDIAKRLKTMYNRGCDIKIAYAVMGNQVLWIFRNGGRGSLPLRQIVQDFDSDGVYDRYLHMKTMTVSGNYQGRGDAQVTFNSSANWSPAALPSDEAGFRVMGPGVRQRYEGWIDYLFAHPPYNPGARRVTTSGGGVDLRGRPGTGSAAPGSLPPWQVERIARERGVDPYAALQVN